MRKKTTRPAPKRGAAFNDSPRLSSGYQPSKAEMNEVVRIDATPEELAQAVMGRHPRRLTH